jgi:hypothetical protein
MYARMYVCLHALVACISACVCARACAQVRVRVRASGLGPFLSWTCPFGPTSAHWCEAGAGRTRARCGRVISGTKVKALPDWLGQCKLLEGLCVRAAAPPPRLTRGSSAGPQRGPMVMPRNTAAYTYVCACVCVTHIHFDVCVCACVRACVRACV